MKKLRIYYEDKGEPENFGLHNLVLACVCDDLGTGEWYRQLTPMFEAHPGKGRDTVLQKCLRDEPRLGSDYATALAILDADKLHDNAAFKGLGCFRDLHVAFGRTFAPRGRVWLFVIEQNTETVVEAACRALGRPASKKKDVNSRDRALNAAANNGDRGVRDKIRKELRSFDRLVRKLTCAHPHLLVA